MNPHLSVLLDELAAFCDAHDGTVTTIELSTEKIALAALPDGGIDLLFLDSKRSAYLDWWPDLKRVLRPGGLLVVDNATSHAHEMADFTGAVRADPAFTPSLALVGKGEFLAVKT